MKKYKKKAKITIKKTDWEKMPKKTVRIA